MFTCDFDPLQYVYNYEDLVRIQGEIVAAVCSAKYPDESYLWTLATVALPIRTAACASILVSVASLSLVYDVRAACRSVSSSGANLTALDLTSASYRTPADY